MIANFYEINFSYEKKNTDIYNLFLDEITSVKATKVFSVDLSKYDNDFFDFMDSNELFYLDDYDDNLFKLDETYYVISDEGKILGVFSPHKGYSFYDVAEHDDRVIIKSAFPNLTCNIIGE